MVRRKKPGLSVAEIERRRRHAAAVQVAASMHKKEVVWRLIAFALGLVCGAGLFWLYLYFRLRGIAS